KREDRTFPRRSHAIAARREYFFKAIAQPRATAMKIAKSRTIVARQHLEHRLGGRERDHIAVQRAGMNDFARSDQFHEFLLSAEHAERGAAADRLRVGREIGGDGVKLLGSTQRQTKAGNHFVED